MVKVMVKVRVTVRVRVRVKVRVRVTFRVKVKVKVRVKVRVRARNEGTLGRTLEKYFQFKYMSLKIVLGATKKVDISCPRSQINRLNYISMRPGWSTRQPASPMTHASTSTCYPSTHSNVPTCTL